MWLFFVVVLKPITITFPSTPIMKPVASTPSTDPPMAGGGPGPASPTLSTSPPKIPPPPLSPLRNGQGGVVVAPPGSPTRKASTSQTVKKPSTTDTGCDCCPQPYKKLELTTLPPLARPPPPPPPPPQASPSKSTDVPPAAVNPTVRPTWMT